MKLSLFSLISFTLSAAAAPAGEDFSLVGFAKDNPIGATTGGQSKQGKSVTVETVADFVKAVTSTESLVVYAKGNFNLTSRVQVGSNKSLIDLGKGAQITGSGLNIYNKTNVIIRNYRRRCHDNP